MIDDTIAAISTPLGAAGIGIVRISGSKAKQILSNLFIDRKGQTKNDFKAYQLNYGYIINKETGDRLDEVLVSYMKGPRSFTAEDVAEVNCHGGIISTRKVLESILREGARLAEPGEFTKRAFLNGRIDLAQAESIIDTINAKTDQSLRVAINQLEGRLSKKVKEISEDIIEVMAFIEAGIDFPEDEIEELSNIQIKEKSNSILNKIDTLLKSANTGKLYRDGISTAIVGKPNVGKSSLLNALLREKRAIVTDVPGTTRDVIEEIININGIPLKIIDTAGIRETSDLVEQIGVEKAKDIALKADLILFILDAEQGLTIEDKNLLMLLSGKKAIVIINKIDLGKLADKDYKEYLKEVQVLEVSAKEETGIEELEQTIYNLVMEGKVDFNQDTFISNVRHQNSLEKARQHISEVLNTIDMGMPTDCMAIDLKGAFESLGEITGETLDEDVIHKIFSQFCIGK